MKTLALALTLAWVLAALPARPEGLYDERSFRAFTADRKAFRPGDLLTVQIYEISSATASTDTSSQRDNAITASAATSAVDGGKPLTGALALGGTFEGGGTTSRANRLLATLTIRVVEVLPNGDLEVAGEQLVRVNEEDQRVRVAGRVRPEDVSPENVVLSTRLSGATIEYVGQGDLSSRSKRAWWRRLLDWLGF